MRLLQAMAGAEFGGAEAFFTRLAMAFQRDGEIEQRVVIRTCPSRRATLQNAGVEVVELPFGGALDITTGLGLKRQINSFKPDVVLTWMNRATDKCPRGKFVKCARLGGYYDLKYYRGCDHLIGNTQDIVDYLVREGWPVDRAHYLPNFVHAEQMPALARKTFFTPDNAPLLLALGRLHENKAFDTLLKALTRAPDVYLWIAGEGPEREKLDDMAKELGIKPRVRFLGWREDTPALFAAADAFICPSRHEPLGNVVIEAWAQGRPVIAADSFGPGTLIDHMKNGILVPVDDDAAMGKSIRWLFDNYDDAQRLAQNGWDAYQENYTEAKVVAKYKEFFAKVAG